MYYFRTFVRLGCFLCIRITFGYCFLGRDAGAENLQQLDNGSDREFDRIVSIDRRSIDLNALMENDDKNDGDDDEILEAGFRETVGDDNIDRFVDSLLEKFNREILAEKSASQLLSDINWLYRATLWNYTVKTELSAERGKVSNFSTIYRTGCTYVSWNESKKALSAIVQLGLEKLSVEYETYRISLFNWLFSKGKLTMNFPGNSAIFQMDLEMPECVAYVRKVSARVPNAKVNFSGLNAINNLIAEKIANGLLVVLKWKIKQFVEPKLSRLVQDALKNRDVCTFVNSYHPRAEVPANNN